MTPSIDGRTFDGYSPEEVRCIIALAIGRIV
jgi:hypothetical protein